VKLLCGTSFSAVLQCKTKSIVVEGMSEVLQQPQLGKGEAAVRHQLQRSPARTPEHMGMSSYMLVLL
jgi:hypothetical protein